jgi:hypothetical protein
LISEEDHIEDLDVTANCTKLVSLKVLCALQCRDNEIFVPFFSVNQFPALEILELNVTLGPKASVTVLDTVMKQPCFGLTHLEINSPLRAQNLRDLVNFPNLKHLKMIKNGTVNCSLQLSGRILLFFNFLIQGFSKFFLEEIEFHSITLSGPQALLEFLLRPQAKYFKKLHFDECTWVNPLNSTQVTSEAGDFFHSYKVRKK